MICARPLPAMLIALSALGLSPLCVHGQGLLTPSDGPGPVFKTLNQVEPRLPLLPSSPGVTVTELGQTWITEPGSYYLTGPIRLSGGITSVITIDSSSVTLDLNGFTISAVEGPQVISSAISITYGRTGISIVNGIISGPGFNNGIFLANGSIYSAMIRVQQVVVESVSFDAINLSIDAQSEVSFCKVRGAFRNGILATAIRNSSAVVSPDATALQGVLVSGSVGEGFVGIRGQLVSDSKGTSLTGGTGIIASHVSNSIGVTSGAPASDGTAVGIKATGAVENSFGQSFSHGVPIEANIAIGCTFQGDNPPVITHRYNMP